MYEWKRAFLSPSRIPAQGPFSLPFMRGPTTGYLTRDQIRISEHRWRP